MSGRKKRATPRPLSQKTISKILASNATQADGAEESVSIGALPNTTGIRLRRDYDYDTLNPDVQISCFIRFIRDAQARYRENLRLIEEYQLQKQDLDHFMELSDNLPAAQGFAYYKLSREMWRKRRACKNEAELLRPLVEFAEQNAAFISELEAIQGGCRRAKESIDQREYIVRTNILNGLTKS